MNYMCWLFVLEKGKRKRTKKKKKEKQFEKRVAFIVFSFLFR